MHKEVSRILRLRGLKVKFQLLKAPNQTVFGQTLDRDIWINLKVSIPPAKIFLHECLHVMYPKMGETDVSRLENGVWRKLTHKEIVFLYNKMMRCVVNSL